MIKDYVTVEDVVRVLDVYDESARELLDGVIDFEADELYLLAADKGVGVEELISG